MTSLGYTIVFVSDMDESIAFYRDVLCFPITHHLWELHLPSRIPYRASIYGLS